MRRTQIVTALAVLGALLGGCASGAEDEAAAPPVVLAAGETERPAAIPITTADPADPQDDDSPEGDAPAEFDPDHGPDQMNHDGTGETTDVDWYTVAPGDVTVEECGYIEPEDSLSDVAYVRVRNSEDVTRHFHITIHTYGPDGVRGEPMYATLYSVAPGESARARTNSGERYVPGLTCKLGQVLATPADGIPDGEYWWLDQGWAGSY